MVNCEAGCGLSPKIGPVHQAIAEIFTSGPLPWGEATVRRATGLVRLRERIDVEVGGI